MSDEARSGEIQFPEEGFILRWNRGGLEIQVTDYHAEVLKLPWSKLLEMARSATGQANVD